MNNIIVDVEADGPVPGLYSMVSFGAVILTPELDKTFYGQLCPITDDYVPRALKVSGHTREECLTFPDPYQVMLDFNMWIMENTPGPRRYFWSDNNGFDFAFINYYFHKYDIENPFGWSSNNINNFYKGLVQSNYARFHILRDTPHTHHPVDDAMGNAEAMLKMIQVYDIRM